MFTGCWNLRIKRVEKTALVRIIKQIQTRQAGNFVAKESAPQKSFRGMNPHDNGKV
jgi:hypothetical protein